MARKAVEANFVMLWESNPRDGLQLTRSVEQPLSIAEYLKALGKYRHLSEEQVGHIQATVEKNVGFIKSLSEGCHPAMAQTMSGQA